MYLIVNEERRIVAASPELLRKAEVESVFDLLTKEDILQFAEKGNLLEINLGERIYQSEGEVLSSLFGSLTILRLEEKVGEEISFPKEEEVLTPESKLIEEPSLEFIEPVSEASEEISEPALQKSMEPEEHTIAEEETISDKLMENEAVPSLKEEGEPEDILPLLLAEETKGEETSEAESSLDETKQPTEFLSSESASQNIEPQELDLLEANQLEVPEAPSIEEFDEEKLQDKSVGDEDLLRIFDEELARENTEEKKSEDFSFEEHLKEEEFEILQKEVPELSESEGITEEPSVSDEKISEEISTFSLPIEESITQEKSSSLFKETSPKKELLDHYTPNAEKNAEKLGLSLEEYLELLSSFIQESHALEASLLSPKTSSSEKALNTLYDAIALLHLDELHEVLDEIRNTPPEQRSAIVEAFYHWLDTSLDRIRETATITHPPLEKESPEESETSAPEVVTHEIETPEVEPETVSEPTIEETVSKEEATETTPELPENELFEDLQPVPIEFSVKIAAEELNLPEDLVLEFINDFATQGHEYLPVLIESYQNNDLDKLQKTAHMLKGAASNLRIEPMVENLYELQFDTDISRAPDRIRLFAGQLMSLDQYLQHMQNK